ncbi:MFS transporter [Saccharothrix xinjiangensis]|uniref:MFS transporter n=1 Tax=Saccharothrix xinjiangensis TaxID=204798 RepID=A0ABV9YJ75_9PSEU
MVKSSRHRGGPVTLLSVGHACVDVYQGSVAALVPFLVSERAYPYAAAAGVVLAASLLSSVVQPLFGVLTDRRSVPWLLPVSTLAAGVGIALCGLTGQYALTLAVVALSGVGVAAYHPEAARVARIAGRGDDRAMSWFSLGGNLGFAAAPLLVSGVVGTGGLAASPLLVLPAVAGALLCAAALRSTGRRQPPGADASRSPAGRDDRASFARLSAAIACRSVVFVGLGTFISLHAGQQVGGATAVATTALFLFYAGGAVGTVLGGRLAGRFGRLRVVRWSYALTAPAVAGAVLVPGPLLLLFAAVTAVGLSVPFSLHITLGQDYLPRHPGTASGVTLGLAVSVGGVAGPLVGALADATSLRVALVPLIALPALGWLFLRTLREPDRHLDRPSS